MVVRTIRYKYCNCYCLLAVQSTRRFRKNVNSCYQIIGSLVVENNTLEITGAPVFAVESLDSLLIFERARIKKN